MTNGITSFQSRSERGASFTTNVQVEDRPSSAFLTISIKVEDDNPRL
jgi:hypothetical protein